jgi:hypothetical protein
MTLVMNDSAQLSRPDASQPRFNPPSVTIRSTLMSPMAQVRVGELPFIRDGFVDVCRGEEEPPGEDRAHTETDQHDMLICGGISANRVHSREQFADDLRGRCNWEKFPIVQLWHIKVYLGGVCITCGLDNIVHLLGSAQPSV